MLAYPDSDNSPPRLPATLIRWAATAAAPLQILAANVPAELDTDVNTVRAAIAETAKGKPLNTDDSSLIGALTGLDHAAHDNCAFTRLDITSVGSDFTGIPATLPPGPVGVSFANHAPGQPIRVHPSRRSNPRRTAVHARSDPERHPRHRQNRRHRRSRPTRGKRHGLRHRQTHARPLRRIHAHREPRKGYPHPRR